MDTGARTPGYGYRESPLDAPAKVLAAGENPEFPSKAGGVPGRICRACPADDMIPKGGDVPPKQAPGREGPSPGFPAGSAGKSSAGPTRKIPEGPQPSGQVQMTTPVRCHWGRGGLPELRSEPAAGFDEVMAERNISRAARNLAMTQPAASNACAGCVRPWGRTW